MGESGVNRSSLSKVPLMCDIYVLFIPKTTPKVIHLPYMVLSAAIIRKGCRACTILGQRGLFSIDPSIQQHSDLNPQGVCRSQTTYSFHFLKSKGLKQKI